VLNDAEERDEHAIRSPAGLSIIQAVEIAAYSSPQVAKPLEEQFLRVMASGREPDVVIRHPEP
jgi:hypothetical protein